MASWLPSLQGLAKGAWHAASYANPWAYGDAPTKKPDPRQVLVPHARPIGDVGGMEGWTSLTVGQTASPVFVTEAKIIPIKRDGNCLYGSIIACIERLEEKGIALQLKGDVILPMSSFAASGSSEFIQILRKAVSGYIIEKCTTILDLELCDLLNATIAGHNIKVNEDYKVTQESIAAMRKMGMDVREAQANLEEETALKMIPEGQPGYKLYTSKVLDDAFWGGYAEVYALSKLLGVEVRVFSDLAEAAFQPPDINRIHAFTASSYPKETQEQNKIILYVRFDPKERHFDVLDAEP